MTLKEYLAEVDRWKEAAGKRLERLSPAQRSAHAQEAKAWLESKLGRPLRAARPAASRPESTG
jgi:hypothetical protein